MITAAPSPIGDPAVRVVALAVGDHDEASLRLQDPQGEESVSEVRLEELDADRVAFQRGAAAEQSEEGPHHVARPRQNDALADALEESDRAREAQAIYNL